MNGYYRINKQRCLQKLESWSKFMIQGQRWKLYDDIHVDEVSKVFQARNRWFHGGLFLLDCLSKKLDHAYDCFLGIPLLEAGCTTDLNDLNIDYIKKNLHDMTPPSLYVFPKEGVEHDEWLGEWIFLDKLSSSRKWNVYFSERYEYDEFVRNVFFLPK